METLAPASPSPQAVASASSHSGATAAPPAPSRLRAWTQRLLGRSGEGPPVPPPNPSALAQEVQDLRTLHEATLRVARARDRDAGLHEILHAALAANGTDKGLLSLAAPDAPGVRLGMSAGFSTEFQQLIPFVPAGHGACGAAFQRRARVIVHDADTDPLFIGLHEVVRLGRFKSCHAVPLVARDGTVLGVLTVHFTRRHAPSEREVRLLDLYAQMAVDFIERWNAEGALRVSERQMQQVLSAMPAGVYTCDLQGRVTYANAAAIALWGRTPSSDDRWCGSHRLYRSDGSPLPMDECFMATAVKTGRYERGGVEVIIERPDGRRRHVAPFLQPMRNAEGQVVGVINVLVDITERVEAQRAREASEARLKQLHSLIPVGVFSIAAPGVFGFCNRRAVELWGFEPRAGQPLREMHAGFNVRWADGRPMTDAESPLELALHHGQTRRDFEIRLQRPDGRELFLNVSVDVVRNERAEVTDVVCVFDDISERKEAELALRQSEERLRLATSTGSVGIWDWDVRGQRVAWTDSLYSIHGVTRDSFDGSLDAFVRLIHPQDRPRVMQAVQASLENGVPYELEFRIQRPDGQIAWVFTSASVVREGGQPVRMLGATLDITRRKQVEELLRESEERLRVATETGRIGIWDWGIRENTIAWTDVLYEFHGVDRRTTRVTPELSRQLIHPEDLGRVSEVTRRALEGAGRYEVECRIVRPDGSVRWLYNNAVVLREDGKPVRMLGASLDITDRKRAETALRASEEQLRFVTDVVPVMLMRCDAEERFVFANRAYLEQRGITLEQLVGRRLEEVIDPESFRALRPYLRRVAAGETVRFEIELPYPALGLRHVSVAYVPEIDDRGNASGFVAAITDVTEFKRADAMSRQLAAIVASSSDAIVGVNLNGVIESWNRGAETLFGYTGAEAVGRNILLIVPPDRQAESVGILERIRRGEHFEHYHTVRRRKDGRLVHISLTISPICDAEGRTVGASKIARDVTELHRAQEAVQQRTRMLEGINRVSSELVAELDLERIVQSVTDAGREVSGAEFGAFFYDQFGGGEGSRPALFTLSGASLREFEEFGLSRHSPVLEPTFRGEAVVRAGDLPRDERFAAARHDTGVRVRSYLAVPVVSRAGEVLGGIVFGHREPDVFSDETERIIVAIAAQAALAIDNAKLYHALERELREKRRTESELLAAQTQLQAHAALLEQHVQERTQSLREAITQMEEFSYTVSHDLRAPLRAMNTYAQALIEDYGAQLDDTARHYLERIQRSSLRMEKLTHDVLTYSRLARSEVRLAPVDLDALLRDMIYQYAEFQPPHAEIKIKRPLHDVLAHEVSLGQCIANLLTNAVKFVAPGVKPKIRIHTELRGESVRLWIIDNGIGIDPQYQSRLFQVFERLHGRQQYEGTGIGLAIVRKAVDKMGGRCGVESDGSNGSRFWIELPPAKL
jgi:PAS domain S-box-containing protein